MSADMQNTIAEVAFDAIQAAAAIEVKDPNVIAHGVAKRILADPRIRIGLRQHRIPAEHGTPARYGAGCRCPECTESIRKYGAATRNRNRGERVLIDGVYVHPKAKHGTTSGYRNYCCRCAHCVAAHRQQKREERARAKARTS